MVGKSEKKKTAMYSHQIGNRVRSRSGGKSIKEHHGEVTRAEGSLTHDGVLNNISNDLTTSRNISISSQMGQRSTGGIQIGLQMRASSKSSQIL
jgi:hypothetical protein